LTLDRYVGGGVHASDGRRCHPSVRGDISTQFCLCFLSVCVFLVLHYHYVITLTPSHVRTPTITRSGHFEHNRSNSRMSAMGAGNYSQYTGSGNTGNNGNTGNSEGKSMFKYK